MRLPVIVGKVCWLFEIIFVGCLDLAKHGKEHVMSNGIEREIAFNLSDRYRPSKFHGCALASNMTCRMRDLRPASSASASVYWSLCHVSPLQLRGIAVSGQFFMHLEQALHIPQNGGFAGYAPNEQSGLRVCVLGVHSAGHRSRELPGGGSPSNAS